MDNTNWRPAVAETNTVMVESADWRTQLGADSRQRIVNKIMDTLKRHLPISGPEGLTELKKIAVRFEEKIYTVAISQSDYLRKISLKMLTMETKSQNTGGANALPQNPVVSNQNPPDSASIDSTAQTGNANTADWQEEAYQKIKAMKETYIPDLSDLYQKVCLKIQQQDSLAQLPKDQVDRLKMMKLFLERVITFLQVSKANIPISYRDKMGNYEKQIVSFLNLHRGVKKPTPHQGQQQIQSSTSGHLQQLKFQDPPRHQMHQQLILQQQQLILQQQKQIASLMALQKGMEPVSSHPGEQ